MSLAGNALEFAALPPERQPQLSFADVAGLGDYLAGSA
jgi:hypothetical protein